MRLCWHHIIHPIGKKDFWSMVNSENFLKCVRKANNFLRLYFLHLCSLLKMTKGHVCAMLEFYVMPCHEKNWFNLCSCGRITFGVVVEYLSWGPFLSSVNGMPRGLMTTLSKEGVSVNPQIKTIIKSIFHINDKEDGSFNGKELFIGAHEDCQMHVPFLIWTLTVEQKTKITMMKL